MHVNAAMFLVETKDLETGEIIHTPGCQGKTVITALDLEQSPGAFIGINRNAVRVLASLKMVGLNLSDLFGVCSD